MAAGRTAQVGSRPSACGERSGAAWVTNRRPRSPRTAWLAAACPVGDHYARDRRALTALIAAVIVGFLGWSICTQHRDAGCGHLGIRRRLQIKVRFVTLDEPDLVHKSGIAL
jgi:hypothetical protein